MAGWIKIYQSIQEHWIWQDPLKLKWWLDMLMLAEWKDKKVTINMKLYVIKRGQIMASVSFLRERWAYFDDEKKRRIPAPNTILKFLSLLEADGMIIRDMEKLPNRITLITICNYNDYQQVKLPEDNALNNTANNTANNTLNNTANNEIEEYIEYKEIKNIKEINQRKADAAFQKPNIEEIKAYIETKGYSVDAETFFNFYESKGWMIGKNKMKNWHAAIATWHKSEKRQSYGISKQGYEDRHRNLEITATGEKDYSTSF